MTSTEVTIIGMTSIGVSSSMTSTGAISIGAKSIAAGQLHMIMVWVDLAGVWGPRGGHGSVCVWGGLYCVCPFICVCMYVFICVHKISDHVCWGCTLTSAKKHCYAISQAPAWAPRVS